MVDESCRRIEHRLQTVYQVDRDTDQYCTAIVAICFITVISSVTQQCYELHLIHLSSPIYQQRCLSVDCWLRPHIDATMQHIDSQDISVGKLEMSRCYFNAVWISYQLTQTVMTTVDDTLHTCIVIGTHQYAHFDGAKLSRNFFNLRGHIRWYYYSAEKSYKWDVVIDTVYILVMQWHHHHQQQQQQQQQQQL